MAGLPRTEAEMNYAFRKAMESSKDTLKLTREEEQKFEKAMKDPDFRKLLSEYVEEISNPEHRKEQEEYIKQLELDNRVPADRELLHPEPAFVFKCRRKQDDSKIFINVCYSDKVAKAEVQRKEQGAQWKLPFSLGPVRMERDKTGGTVPTYDICFHKEIVLMASTNPRLRGLIVQTAMENVEKVRRDTYSGSDESLKKEFHILKGVQYKSGTPAVMLLSKAKPHVEPSKPISTASKERTRQENASPAEGGSSSVLTTTDVQVKDPREEHQNPALVSESSSDVHTSDKAPEQLKYEAQPRQPPTYNITERGKIDLSQFTEDRRVRSERPAELVVRVNLPLLRSAAGVGLDISERMLCLRFDENQYAALDVRLPYPIREETAKASFDKKKGLLVITLSVRPRAAPEGAGDEASAVVEPQAPAQSEDPDPEDMETQRDLEGLANDSSHIRHDRWIDPTQKQQRQDEDIKLLLDNARKDVVSAPTPLFTTTSRNTEAKEGILVPSNNDEDGSDRVAVLTAEDKLSTVPSLGGTSLQEETNSHAAPVPERSDHGLRDAEPGDLKEPSYVFRQTEKVVTLLVKVPNIEPSSVMSEWHSKQIKISFFAVNEKTSERTGYRLEISLHGEIVPSKCKYDVATLNMVIVLEKETPGRWSSLKGEPGREKENGHPSEHISKTGSKLFAALEVPPTVTKVSFSNQIMFELD